MAPDIGKIALLVITFVVLLILSYFHFFKVEWMWERHIKSIQHAGSKPERTKAEWAQLIRHIGILFVVFALLAGFLIFAELFWRF